MKILIILCVIAFIKLEALPNEALTALILPQWDSLLYVCGY
jgi:hypothetical protein